MNKLPERIRIKDIARLADVSVGTVDRVIHGRSGVSEASKKRVEEILKQLDYQPNMYASALASNKKYTFICLLPQHLEGEYWTAVELGIHEAIATYSDFNTSVKINYYDPYDYHSFVDASEAILTQQPDGVMVAPTAPQYTKGFTDQLQTLDIPYIYIDSNIKEDVYKRQTLPEAVTTPSRWCTAPTWLRHTPTLPHTCGCNMASKPMH